MMSPDQFEELPPRVGVVVIGKVLVRCMARIIIGDEPEFVTEEVQIWMLSPSKLLGHCRRDCPCLLGARGEARYSRGLCEQELSHQTANIPPRPAVVVEIQQAAWL